MREVTRAAEEPRPVLLAALRGTAKWENLPSAGLRGEVVEDWE